MAIRPTPGRSLVTRRAVADIVRTATLGSYGVTGFAGGPIQQLIRVLGLGQPGLAVRLGQGIHIELDLTVALGVPIAEVARQLDSAVRYAIRRALDEIKSGPPDESQMDRTEKYMSSKLVIVLIGIMFLAMIGLYYFLSGNVVASLVAAIVMIVVGFFFAAISGSLVGFIGSSNNPVSGLTISTLIIAGLLMIALGATGPSGVAVVLGVAAVVCVSSAVAGELLQLTFERFG